jgi:hypothetical protein
LKFKFFIATFDLWVGVYHDRKKKIWYVCPFPCLVFSFASDENFWRDGKWSD